MVSKQAVLKALGTEGLQSKQKQQQQDFWVHKESLKPHNTEIICCSVFFSLWFSLTNIAVLCLILIVRVPISPQALNRCIYAYRTQTG